MRVSIIAAIAKNGVIGRDNQLPWRVATDLEFFMKKTEGHVVITGRKNFEAMGEALPRRTNIVVTRAERYVAPDAIVCPSVEQALHLAQARSEAEAFVIGGAQIYERALPYAHTIYLTTILAEVAGDIYFPAFDATEWTASEIMRGERDTENEHAFVVQELTRKRPPVPFATAARAVP